MFRNKRRERGRIRLPIFRESFKVLENGVNAVFRKQGYRVLGVPVEIGVEDSLVHEVSFLANVEQYPSKVVELETWESVGDIGHRFLDRLSVRSNRLLSSRFDLRNKSKTMAGWRSRIERPISSALKLEVPLLWNRHRGWFRPIILLRYLIAWSCFCSHTILLTVV